MRARLGPLALYLLFVVSAHSATIYSNYGPGFAYDASGAWIVDYPGVGFNPAMPFTPTATATLGAIYLNVGTDYAISSLDITLRADSNGAPGAVIESFNVTSAPDALNGVIFPPLELTSSLNPVLYSGQQYWLAATSHDPGGQFGWWKNSSGDSGQVFLVHDGIPGVVTNTRGVFELTSTPEPLSVVIAFCGLVLLLLRRLACQL